MRFTAYLCAAVIGSSTYLSTAAFAGGGMVLVLQGAGDDRTMAITDGFKASFKDASKMTYQLGDTDDAAAFVADGLRTMKFEAVFAIGDRAATAAAREFVGIPLVYADVSNPSVLTSRPDALGVAVRVDPVVTVQNLHTLMPQMRKLGVIRSARDDKGDYWTALDKACSDNKISLTITNASPESLDKALSQVLLSSDAVLILPDGRLWTASSVGKVLSTAAREKKVVIGFDRAQLQAPQPAGLILEGDPTGIGTAAGELLTVTMGGKSATASYPAPKIIGHMGALRSNGVLVSKKTSVVVQEWIDRKSKNKK